MAMNLLNIDELAPAKKELTIKGQTHTMHTVTVAEFIEFMRESQPSNEEAEKMSMDQRMEQLVSQVKKAFPTVPDEDLGGLALEQLIAIIQFISGTLKEEAEVKATAGKGKNA